MATWKKVLVSGSSTQHLHITSSGQISASLGFVGALTGTASNATTIEAGDLASTKVFVGNGSNLATAVSLGGEVTMNNAGAVTIENDAITTIKILNDNVTTAKINDLAVTTGKINDLAVTTGKIADDQVTGDKLANSITIAADITVAGSIIISTGKISYGTNTNVDIGTENVATATGAEAAFFDYVVKNSTNVRAGTITAATDGTNVEYNEISTVDLGNTSDIKLKVVLDGSNLILQARAASDDWNVSSFIRYMAL